MRAPLLRCFSLCTLTLSAACLFSQNLPKQFITPQQVNRSIIGALIGAGDLNGDGRPDILYTNTEEIATGPGMFRAVPLANSGFIAGSKLADVNGDGILDVIEPVPAVEECDQNPDGSYYCNQIADAQLWVSFGNGDGSFRAGPTLDLGPSGVGNATLVMADVNGDGKLDALVSFDGDLGSQCGGCSNLNATPTTIVALNNGSGTFHVASSNSGAQSVIATGDFNGDGKLDMAVRLNGLTILYGKGDGTFTTGQSFTSFTPYAGAAGDFNHDGHIDIAASNANGGIYILWGGADGVLASPKRLSEFTAYQLAAVDLNHDGYLDLVAGSSSIAVFANQRNGTFSGPRVYEGGAFLGQFALANFSGDPYLDLVLANLIFYGSSGGQFQAPQVALTPYAGYGSIVTGDFSRDGIADVAVASPFYKNVTVFTGTGKSYFNPPTTYYTGLPDGNISVGDVNGDGIEDLVVTAPLNGGYSASVLLGNGDGTFRPAITSKFSSSVVNSDNHQVYLIDVNHDGKGDLVGEWGVALGKGDGTFGPPTPFPSQVAAPIMGIATGDFNRDGNVDLVVGSQKTATIYTLLGNGQGGFTVSHSEKLDYANPTLNALTIADMNDDGIPDLIYEYSAKPSSGSYDRVVVEIGDGSGSFSIAGSQRMKYNGQGNYTLLVSDFNRTGDPDVLVLNQSVFSIDELMPYDSEFFKGYGDGTLSAAQYVPVQMYSGVAIDVNGDGYPDVVGPASDETGVERMLNTGPQ